MVIGIHIQWWGKPMTVLFKDVWNLRRALARLYNDFSDGLITKHGINPMLVDMEPLLFREELRV